MALGGRDRARNDPRYMGGAAGPAKRGPQSGITALLHDDVIALTTGRRALTLSTIPTRTRTYFGPYKPGTAQRIPPMVDRADPNNVRRTLIARAQLLVANQKQAGQ